MAREFLLSGSSPCCSAPPPTASVVVLGTMQQLQQPQAAVSSSRSPRDPSECRNIWSFEESSPSSSTLGGSPVESLTGCNETESDEDECDYIAGLAEQIAHSMLDDDDRSEENSNGVVWTSEKIRVPAWNVQISLPTSPQSTLAGLEWCGSKRFTSYSVPSSNGSSQVASRVSSPKLTSIERGDDAWDLLYAAAGEVAKLNSSEERRALATTFMPTRSGLCKAGTHQRRQFPAYMKQSVVSSPSFPSPGGSAKDFPLHSRNSEVLSSGSSCYGEKSNPTPLSYIQRSSRAKAKDEERGNTSQYYRASKLGVSSSLGCRGGGRLRDLPPSSGSGRHRGGVGSSQRLSLRDSDLLSTHHFPPLGQQQAFLGGNSGGSAVGSGMRAVFLGSASSRESGGTGVFLPRRIGCGSEAKKKPACSTVLLPSRIVEALNLNMEGVISGSASPPLIPVSRRGVTSPAASLRPIVEPSGSSVSPSCAPREEWTENRWTTPRPACSPLPQEGTPEINLPTEWTY